MTDHLTVRLEFVSADPTRPDPASVSAVADAALADLRARGLVAQPVYTGAMGGDVYEIARQFAQGLADHKEVLLALIGLATPIVSALAERVKRPPPTPSPASPSSVTIIVQLGNAQAEVSDPAITPDELLERLLAVDPALAGQVTPTTPVVVQVMVERHEGDDEVRE